MRRTAGRGARTGGSAGGSRSARPANVRSASGAGRAARWSRCRGGRSAGDPPSAQPGPQVLVVIALVGVRLRRSAPAWPAPGADRGDGLYQRDQRLLSWVLAAVTATASGNPVVSVRTCSLEPGLSRST